MTTPEFSDEFDILLNSYSTIEPKGLTQDISNIKLDEYEKSIYLTNAQDELLRQLISSGFEANEELRRALNKTLKHYTSTTKITSIDHIDENTIFFPIPNDTMKIVSETVLTTNPLESCYNNVKLTVVPITHDEYELQKSNPFKRPKLNGRTRQAWRIDYGDIENQSIVEIVPPIESSLHSYTMRYLPKLTPIILTNLNYLTIGGLNQVTECKLDSLLHREILKLAVQNALRVIVGTTQTEEN